MFLIGCFNSYFYPMKYKEEIIEISKKYSIDSALVASIINVESSYDKDVVSNKGAVGLMQLLPSTAEWIAQYNKFDFSEEKLFQPYFNIELGTCYLKYLINIFDDEKNGICAYNAGIGNVQKWLMNKEYSDDGLHLKEIPFEETDNYLNRVYKNYYYYKNRYK